MSQASLTYYFVGGIKGHFFIPSYQRGYRWGVEEVTRLLEDIHQNGDQPYCLQPIVLRRQPQSDSSDTTYELIDGQQRLTTLYLIYHYLHAASGAFLDGPAFTIDYATRKKSADFLRDIDPTRRDENIDFWHIVEAYEAIDSWFKAKDCKSTMTNINKFFDENVKIIWYEVDSDTNAINLFTRLNIGKIPLTNAELVKALFLRQSQDDARRTRQEEIALQWDDIEKELHDPSLWAFLTNSKEKSSDTRIDLVLDLIAQKPLGTRDQYYTFFELDRRIKEQGPAAVWSEIQRSFLTLKDWFEDHELYHKIGYLIASKSCTLGEIYALSLGQRKHEFRAALDDAIRKSIAIPEDSNYEDLSYGYQSALISRILLLFNVVSVYQIDEQAQRFPFEQFKSGGAWSIEHIHAQNSDNLNTVEEWTNWLEDHLEALRSLPAGSRPHLPELIRETTELLNSGELVGDDFFEIQERIVEALSSDNTEYLHSIDNLALLQSDNNSALNNSVFDVKRKRIIEMDKKGEYIPFCTKMVFLKYYTPSDSLQMHFWGEADRKAYVAAINKTLAPYLSKPINLGGN